jgi:HK97 family phage portal protein
MLIEQDRRSRPAPQAAGETYPISTGTRGSTLYSWLTEGMTGAVSEAQAMRVGAVYASVGLIGRAIGALPFHIYERTKDGRDRVDDDLWWLFNESPHAAWTAASSWLYTAQSILLEGDAYWQIQRASKYSPKIIGFEPHHPQAVRTKRVDGRNRYTIYAARGDGSVERRELDQDDVLHFPGIGFNGLRSLTPIQAALGSTADLALAADNHASAFFRGGARPDLAIVVPPAMKINEDHRQLMRETWSEQRKHYNDTGIPPVLVGGMELKPITLNAQDAQLLETRKQSVEDIARIMGVPPHMIGKTDASTSWGTGIEQMSIGFYPLHADRTSGRDSAGDQPQVLAAASAVSGEHNVEALLEGDSKHKRISRQGAWGPGSQGWMTVNQVRKLKNMPPLDDEWANTVQRAGSKAPATTNEENTNA